MAGVPVKHIVDGRETTVAEMADELGKKLMQVVYDMQK